MILSIVLGALLVGSGGKDSSALEGAVRTVILDQARSAGEEAVIEAIKIPRALHARGEGTFTVEPPLQGRTGGHVVVMVDWSVPGSGLERFPVSCTVHRFADAYVATHLIDRHATLMQGDVVLRRVETTHLAQTYVHDASAFAGRRTQRIIQEGAVLSTAMLEEEPTIHVGDPVVLLTRSAGVSVTISAIAREDGHKGSLITVQPVGGHQRFRGKVRDARTVERSAD